MKATIYGNGTTDTLKVDTLEAALELPVTDYLIVTTSRNVTRHYVPKGQDWKFNYEVIKDPDATYNRKGK